MLFRSPTRRSPASEGEGGSIRGLDLAWCPLCLCGEIFLVQ
jgi:hypothetical protein